MALVVTTVRLRDNGALLHRSKVTATIKALLSQTMPTTLRLSSTILLPNNNITSNTNNLPPSNTAAAAATRKEAMYLKVSSASATAHPIATTSSTVSVLESARPC